jgi:hypothetical protein
MIETIGTETAPSSSVLDALDTVEEEWLDEVEVP